MLKLVVDEVSIGFTLGMAGIDRKQQEGVFRGAGNVLS